MIEKIEQWTRGWRVTGRGTKELSRLIGMCYILIGICWLHSYICLSEFINVPKKDLCILLHKKCFKNNSHKISVFKTGLDNQFVN